MRQFFTNKHRVQLFLKGFSLLETVFIIMKQVFTKKQDIGLVYPCQKNKSIVLNIKSLVFFLCFCIGNSVIFAHTGTIFYDFNRSTYSGGGDTLAKIGNKDGFPVHTFRATVFGAGNTYPVAVDDNDTTTVDATVTTVDVTTNDTDAELETLTLIDFTQAPNGTVVDNGDGTFDYTPDLAYTGLDSFDYLIIDSGSDLSHHWGLNGNGTDAVGAANGTINGTTTITGAFGDALSFNESITDYVQVPDFTYNNEYTITFDFKIDDNTGSLFQYIYSHGNVGSTNSVNVFLLEDAHGSDPNQFRTVVRDTDDALDNFALPFDASTLIGDGLWHTYTLIVNSSGSTVYIDGIQKVSNALYGGDSFDPAGDLYLGARDDLAADRFYGGSLDNVQVYGWPLSTSEITDHNNETNRGTVNVNVLTSLTLSTSITPISSSSASDGAIDLTVSGGTEPYTYNWSNSATTEDISGLAAGTYAVTVTDALSLTETTSVTIVYIAQKYLYLTDPSQGLDRTDPVATSDVTTASTTAINAAESAAVADNFDTGDSFAGTNSTGSLDWTTDWVDNDAGGVGPTFGNVSAFLHILQIADNNLGDDVYREVDLSSVATAIVSFDFVNGMSNNSDNLTIELSKDGGASYPHTLFFFDENTIDGNKATAELVAAIGALTANTRIRFRVSGTGGNSGNLSIFDNVNIAYTITGNPTQTFTQGTAMCSDFTIKSGESITVTAYANVTSGTMPASPDIDAQLRYGATGIILLSNPTWNSGTNLLTWTGSLGSDVTVPAGEAILLGITTNESVVAFQIEYDSDTKPSKIQIPTETFINVDALDVYDAAYSGGSIITTGDAGSTAYIRAVVSDPFGFADITNMDIDIISLIPDTTTVTATSVATAGCTRTYEYVWSTPANPTGNYSLKAIASEGTEGVTADSTTTFNILSPITVSKVLFTPATGPFTIGDTLTYRIVIDNQSAAAITTLPFQDIFDSSCLQFLSATTTESSIGTGTIIWDDLGSVNAGSSINLGVLFTVIGNCDPTINIGKMQGAIDEFSNSIATQTDTISINIDEPPVANDDEFCVSGMENLNVLANDTDADNDLTTLTITSAPLLGTATVLGNNTIDYTPDGGMVDNDTTSFVYQICDNADVTPYCETATVIVSFSTVNDAPTIVDDNVSTTLNLPFTFNPLSNDSDIDGSIDASSVTIKIAPSFGTATVNADGTIYYVPNPGFEGVDQLTYEVCDNGCPAPVACLTAIVDINVVFVQYVCTSSTSDTLTTAAIPDAVSYTWSLPAGAVITSLPIDSNIVVVDWSAVTPGQYSMCVLATNDCGDGTQTCQDIVVNTLVLTTSPTDILCNSDNSGAIDLTASGGIPTYTYNWDNGSTIEDLSSIGAGTYNVTVTDAYGCIASTSETLTEPATALSLSGVITDENPFGTANGAINITASGGTTPYTYLWSNASINEDLTDLSGGTYMVTVTDLNGCTITETFTVNTIGGPLTVSSIVSTDVLCNAGTDGTINLEIIGGSGVYTYDWDNDGTGDFDDTQDLTGLSADTYNVTISDGVNPNITSSATVSEPGTAVTASATGTDVSCNGNTDGAVDLTASGGTGTLTYSWSKGDTSQDLTNVAAGTYNVTVTDENGCTATASQVITEPAALTASGVTTDTPCDPGNTGAIDLTVSGGSMPYTFAWTGGGTSEDTTGLTAGTYAVTITDNNSCTDIQTFTINNACIGLAKTISSGPTNNNDGTYTLTYDIKVKNEGDIALDSVQIVEDLATTYASATAYAIDLVFSSDFTSNGSFDGNAAPDLLVNGESLAAGDSGLVQITLTITPGTTLGVYNNSVTTSAKSAEGIATSDISHNGTETDPEGDGPTDNSDPTPVTFTESPLIGVAKTITSGPTNNGDGTYDLTYQILIRNMGDVPLTNVQVSDTLSNTFSGATVMVNSLTSADMTVNSPAYDGTSDYNLLAGTDGMAINQIDTINLSLTVTPSTNLGIHNNTAVGQGTSPSSATVTDDSQDGTDVDPTDGSGGASDGDPTNDDVPTPVTFTESPEIGIAKALIGTPVNNGDGTYTLSYQVLVKNTGDVPLTNVQVSDSLDVTFGGATLVINSLTSSDMAVNSPAYDGTSDYNLLAGTDGMLVGEQDTISLTLTVTPGTNLGPYNNTAIGQGTSTGGTVVMDDSHDGAQVDPENDGTSDNSDPTSVTFTETPEIGIAKNVFTAPVSNNDSSYTLTYMLLIDNTGDVPLTDVQITDSLSTTFAAATSYTVDSVYSPDLSVNFPGYDGNTTPVLLAGTDGMLVGEQDTVFITLTVIPGTTLGVYNNTATANANGAGGTPVSDDSYDGTNSDPDSNGDPTDNSLPTPITFVENPQLGVAKVVTANIDNMNGTYSVSYDIKIKNIGDVYIKNLHLIDNLSETFIEAASFSVTSISSTDVTVNGTYDGSTDIELLADTPDLGVGDSVIIAITVLIDPGTYIKPFNNEAFSYGTTPSGTTVLDNSTDGTNVDPDGDGNPSNNSDPTPVEFASAVIGAAKAVTSGPTLVSEGLYSVTYQMKATNMGDYDLFDVQLFDTLSTEYGTYVVATPVNAGEYTISTTPSIDLIAAGSALTVNSSFTGSGSNTSLVNFNSGDSLQMGDSVMISFTLEFRPMNAKTAFSNQITASGDQTETLTAEGDATDLSDEGTLVDEDGDGIPTEDLNNVEDNSNENDPTEFTIDYVPTAYQDDTTTIVNTLVNIIVLANDTFGIDGPLLDSITITQQPTNGIAVVNDGGTPNDQTDDTIDYTPNMDYTGVDTLIYQICDLDNDCDTALVVITIESGCPTIDSLIADRIVCSGDLVDTLAVITTVENPDSIAFVYFTTQQTGSNMYSGGTGIDTIQIAAANDTARLINIAFPTNTSGSPITYYVYAIYLPIPIDAGCRPYEEMLVTVNSTSTGMETYTGCAGDGYSVTVNGTLYNEANAGGTEVLTNAAGCDSTVTVTLQEMAILLL